jgi:hypothetical protein
VSLSAHAMHQNRGDGFGAGVLDNVGADVAGRDLSGEGDVERANGGKDGARGGAGAGNLVGPTAKHRAGAPDGNFKRD